MRQKEIRKKNFKKDGLLFYILMFAVPIAQFCIFYIGVNFNSILLAFKNYDAITGNYSFAKFDNFKQFFHNITLGTELSWAFRNSLKLWLVSLAIGTTFALLFSFYIYKKKFMYNTLRVFLFLPSMLSSIVMSIIFNYILGRGLTSIGIPDYLNKLDTQFTTIIVYNIWVGFGSSVLLYSGSMGQISPEMLEAAEVDGASSLRVFICIVLPSIFPTISTFVITGVAGIFINQANLYNFFGGGAPASSYTIGYYLFVQVIGNTGGGMTSYPYAAAGGLILTLIAAPATLFVKFLLEKFGPSED